VDLLRFEALCREGGAAARAGAWPRAAGLLSEALGLWRGSPLEDAASQVLRDACLPRLEQLRLQALEWRIEADLHLGRHGQLIPELQALVGEDPLREHAHAQLMLALYRSGRQGEALAAYQGARRVLVTELGAEPGPGLRELHQQILTGDPAISAPPPEPSDDVAPAADPAHGTAVVPRQLPAAIAHFTGRADAFEALAGLARQAGGGAATVIISAIGGTAGIGKTALAVQWGQRNADLFPDGQLYVNLRGYDPAGAAVKPSAAIPGFLQALGVPPAQVPAGQDAQAALYRSLLAGRRMLVVLDNANDSDQVRPLLPGSAGCLVLVTSRSQLTGLVAVDGAHPLTVDLLTEEESRDLLTRRLGAVRAAAEPVAVDELAALCARLPLALNITAARAIARPDVPLAALAGQLRDSRGRLAALDTGDGAASVRAVFSWSLRDLDADAARVFRLAGLQPGPGLDRYAAAALAGVTPEHAAGLMDRLARAHLLRPAGPVRYDMHDLLRAYACELAAAADGEAECRAALTRLFDYCLHTAAAAMDTLFPAERHRRPRVSPPAVAAPLLTDGAAARAWLDAERASLTAVTQYAAERGWPGHAARLAATLARYLDTGGYYSEALVIHASASHAARCTGDSGAEGTALTNTGTVHMRQGRDQQAVSCFKQAQSLARQVGDRRGEARALGNLGIAVDHAQGRYQEAVGYLQQSLELFRELGDRIGEAHDLIDLADIGRRQGRYEQAAGYLRQALQLTREGGDRLGEAYSTGILGLVAQRQGAQEAAGYLQQSLELFRELGDQDGEAHALNNLGEASRREGRYPQAVSYHQQALDLSRQTLYQPGQAEALNGLGEAFLALGQPDLAQARHSSALALARHTGDRAQQASACHGLARACHAAADHGRARRHWQEALALYTSLGAAEADQVRAQLTAAVTASR
jgi:tetratricopeptide (TPR) repeat protein